MLRNRLIILLAGCFLTASAAWADDLGYIDCSNHPDETQVFAKARKTPDVVASVPCGERFTVLIYGFVFSRIQTRDGRVGYVYSNVISVDRSGASVQRTASSQAPPATSNAQSTAAATSAQPAAPAPPQSQPAAPQPAPTQTSVAASNVPQTSVAAAPSTSPTPVRPQAAPAQEVPAPAASSSVPEATAAIAQPAPPAPEPAPAQAMPAPVPVATSNVPERTATVAQPDSTPAAQPQPEPAQPAASSFRPADTRTSWEKPLPSIRTTPLIELFGGYSFARMVSGGTGTNFNGALGSFGWNFKPWLQIVADSSYNVVTISGTKNVLYGNHYGPRVFRRGRNRWGITPFGEALFGGSRADTTVSGAGGYTTSVSGFSIKAGGGIDIHPSRHIDIRLFDVDYYRTSFGTNLHQNNYWASTGIVLRLFGGRSE